MRLAVGVGDEDELRVGRRQNVIEQKRKRTSLLPVFHCQHNIFEKLSRINFVAQNTARRVFFFYTGVHNFCRDPQCERENIKLFG